MRLLRVSDNPRYGFSRVMLIAIPKPRGALAALLLGIAIFGAAMPTFAAPDGRSPVGPKDKEHVDDFGDPLPDQVLFRVGTTRLQHQGQVQSIAASADGRFLASCGSDKVVKVWDAKDGRPIHKFDLPFAGTWGIAFSRDGKRVAAVSKAVPRGEGVFRRWELANGQELTKAVDAKPADGWAFHVALTCQEDGKFLVAETAEANIGLYSPGDAKSGKLLKGHTGRVMCVSFTADAKTLASLGDDGVIRLWNTEDGKEIGSLPAPKMKEHGLNGNLAFVAISADANRLAVTLPDGSTRLLDVEGHELRRLPTKLQMSSLTFSHDGRTLITGSNVVEMWNVEDAKPISIVNESRTPIRTLSLSPDGKLAAYATDRGQVRLVDVATGKPFSQRELPCHGGIAFSRDSHLLAIAPGDDTIAFWDVVNLCSSESVPSKPAVDFRCEGKVKTFAFSPDGKRLATVEEGRVARIYDIASQKNLTTMRPTSRGVYAVAFSPDGKLLATVGDQPFYHFGGNQVPTQSVGLWESATGIELTLREDLRELAHTLVFHPNGKSLAAVHLPIYARQPGLGGGLDIRSVDKGAHATQEERMETIRIWDIASKRESRRFEDPVHRKLAEVATAWITGRSQAVAAAFSPDGAIFATAGPGGIVLFETASGQPRLRLSGHLQEITGLAFTPDGNTLVSTSWDSTLLIWDVSGRRTGKTLRANSEELWKLLADANIEKAGRAVYAMVESPDETLALLQKRIKAVSVSPERFQELIADLDHAKFAVREQAGIELAALGPAAEPALKKRLQAKPSLEVVGRIEKLLGSIQSMRPSQDQLRVIRAVEILEHIGTPKAIAFLRELAGGAEGAHLTSHAKEAIERVDRRASK
jgi:WD40 repeat protein